MPPKTRGNKITKASKENISVNTINKRKKYDIVSKPGRKALADKTNSASDDDASILSSRVTKKATANEESLLVKQRPRRNRRLPTRYVQSNLLQNLSNSKNAIIESPEPSKSLQRNKIPIVVISPLNTPKIIRKPKRIRKLPCKLEENLISPNKFVTIQPAYASTPKVQTNKTKTIITIDSNKKVNLRNTSSYDKSTLNKIKSKRIVRKTSNDTSKNDSADSNNNANKNQLPPYKTKNVLSSVSKVFPITEKTNKKPVKNNFSFKILEDRNNSLKRNANKIDIYEFTYDPNEEPPPQKKKRRKPAKKKEPKPKAMIIKNNYDRNLAKALLALKNTVTLKSSQPVIIPHDAKVIPDNPKTIMSDTPNAADQVDVQHSVNNPALLNESQPNKSQDSKSNYNSVRVEDIALDFEQESIVDDVNYSPVNSPINPSLQNVDDQNAEIPAPNNDPLNLRDDLSFFDDQPVASSSMNVSVRHSEASPWRVEFNDLPIKWQVNTYVKPNMTPAFDSSFINFNESKKKHVYTNMGPDDVNTNKDNNLPPIFEENTSKLKQTSIISFIKEVVEKNTKKEKEKNTPKKVNNLFEDFNDTSVLNKVPVKACKSLQNNNTSDKDKSSSNEDINSKIVNKNGRKEKREERLKKSSKKKKDTDITYFGFDENESQDQENVSPIKTVDKRRLRALKPRSRAVLQEINGKAEPIRAALPLAMKSKVTENSDSANKLFDQMISAATPPVFPDEVPIENPESLHITELQNNEDSNNMDDQSVHLFEDLELVHHLKANRKSYGKAKKAVTFRQNSFSDSDVVPSDVAERSASSDDEDLHDLTFKVPALEPKKPKKTKKKTKKQKLSKKEEQEVDAWAAGFNSMCEDIEEFDLVVE